MKKLILSGSLMLLSLCAMAVPAKRTTTTVTQADGDVVTLTRSGDEFLHYYLTTDKKPVVMGNDGRYYFASVQGDRLVASSHLVQSVEKRSAQTVEFLNASNASDELSKARSARIAARKSPKKAAARVNSDAVTGKKKGLVILVNFKDKSFSMSDPVATYTSLLNDENYNSYGMNGSVHEYFYDQSNGKFDLTFDVVGPVQLAQNIKYYGGNDSWGEDLNPEEMIIEACDAAYKQGIDFSQYDWNGDGEADQVFVLYAGYGEAQSPDKDLVWPHEWLLSESSKGKQKYGDTYVDTYACSSELSGSTGKNIDGIGTICHEFSHCLGLPDFYDTQGYSFGMDSWSLMDYGCYNNDGKTPCNYTAYERWYIGWSEPIELNGGSIVTDMIPVSDGGNSYIIYNQGNKNEYYVLENKQKTGWDKYAGGHGMLVVHVDYNASIWEQNSVNDVSSRNRCTIIPADNDLSDTSLSGDPFPGTKNKTELTNTSTPKASVYNTNSDGSRLLNHPIENIAETSDGKISFDFDGGVHIASPVLDDPFDITESGFSLKWSEVADADSYTVRLMASDANNTMTLALAESFKGLVAAKDNSSDISSKLDTYTDQPGWTGTKVYAGVNGPKLGSSSVVGNLTSPAIEFTSAAGTVTVNAVLTPYGNDNTSVNISLLDANGNELDKVTTQATGELATVVLENAQGKCKVKISPAKRGYVKDVEIFDGNDGRAEGIAPKKASKELLTTDVKETSYTFTNLETATRYICSVKSVNSVEESAYSNTKVVVLEGTNGIESILDGSNNDCNIYDIHGRLITVVKKGDSGVTLPAGIYIKKQGNSVEKVIVR